MPVLSAKNIRVKKKIVIAARNMRGLLGTGNVQHQNVLCLNLGTITQCVQFAGIHQAIYFDIVQ